MKINNYLLLLTVYVIFQSIILLIIIINVVSVMLKYELQKHCKAKKYI